MIGELKKIVIITIAIPCVIYFLNEVIHFLQIQKRRPKNEHFLGDIHGIP